MTIKTLAEFVQFSKEIVPQIIHFVLQSHPLLDYSSVPNRRVGRNKRAGGKILKKH